MVSYRLEHVRRSKGGLRRNVGHGEGRPRRDEETKAIQCAWRTSWLLVSSGTRVGSEWVSNQHCTSPHTIYR
jgi:hypothetical protein